MVEKKDGATTECKNCGGDLICRLKDYGGNYKPTLQWQNFDGTAHYKTTDGKNFECNIPDDDENIGNTPATTPGDPKQTTIGRADFVLLASFEKKIDILLHDIEIIKEMVSPMFQKMVDEQLGRRDE